jgi:tol-pal system protein YbgF
MNTHSYNRYVLWLPVFVLVTLLFSSCVYDKEFSYLNDQIIALNRRVTSLQETVDTKISRDLESRLELIRSNQKEVRVEIDQLKKELRDLAGRTEDNEHIIKRAVERDLGEQDARDAALTDLTKKVTDLERAVRVQQEYLGLEALVGAEEREKGPGEEAQAPAGESGVTEEPKSEELALYDISLASYRDGKYENAMDGFKDFLKRYPKSDRADNAQFWIAESFMALKQYEQAILSYQEVIKKFPEGNKVPNALLRQSAAFWEIKDKTSARLLLKKIVKKYPNSNEAKIAQKRLKTLK